MIWERNVGLGEEERRGDVQTITDPRIYWVSEGEVLRITEALHATKRVKNGGSACVARRGNGMADG